MVVVRDICYVDVGHGHLVSLIAIPPSQLKFHKEAENPALDLEEGNSRMAFQIRRKQMRESSHSQRQLQGASTG